MKQYELVVLMHPDLEIDLDRPMKKIEKIIKDNEGKITKSDIWGKRKLSYPIIKEDFAVYVYYELDLPVDSITKVEQALNIADEVIRYLITYPVPKIEKSEKSKNKDEIETDADNNEEEK